MMILCVLCGQPVAAAKVLPAIAPAAAASNPPTGSAAPARALFLRLVHPDGFSVQTYAVHLRDGRLRIFILSKSHESKTARPPRTAVCNDLGFGDLPMRGKRLAQAFVRRIPAQPPYKQFLSHTFSEAPFPASPRATTVDA
jgi:hypothetical protein